MRGTGARVMPCAAGAPVRVAGNDASGQLCAGAPVRVIRGDCGGRMPCAGVCIPGHDIGARGALWRGCMACPGGMAWRVLRALRRVERVRVAHGIAGGIVRRVARFQRVAGHCAARGGFSARGGALWRGAWRVYSGAGGRVENAQTIDL